MQHAPEEKCLMNDLLSVDQVAIPATDDVTILLRVLQIAALERVDLSL